MYQVQMLDGSSFSVNTPAESQDYYGDVNVSKVTTSLPDGSVAVVYDRGDQPKENL